MTSVAHLIELLDPKHRLMVEKRIIMIVAGSFEQDERRAAKALIKAPMPTQSEVRRRTNIVYNWLGVMRNDFDYSIFRTLDCLPHALRATLDGQGYEPAPANTAWSGRRG